MLKPHSPLKLHAEAFAQLVNSIQRSSISMANPIFGTQTLLNITASTWLNTHSTQTIVQ